MSAVCRPLVSAPQSRFPYGHWPMDSEEVAAFATECGSRYGTVIPVRKQAAVEEACRLFYYPVYGKSELSLRVPVRQMETVASY